MGWKTLGVVILAAVLLSPPASAEAASGSFTFDGPFSIPPGSEVRGAPFAAYVENQHHPLRLKTFDATAPVLHLQVWTQNLTNAQVLDTFLGVDSANDIWSYELILYNATVSLAGEPQRGYVAFDVDQGADVSLWPDVDSDLQALVNTTLAFGADGGTLPVPGGTSAPKPSQPEDHYYLRHFADPHILAGAPGTLTLDGATTVKLFGATMRVSSDEGDLSLATGQFNYSAPHVENGNVSNAYRRWAILASPAFELRASSPEPWNVAAPEVEAIWTGAFVFDDVEGEIRTEDATYVAKGTPMRLKGAFQSTISPFLKDGSVQTHAVIQGNLEDTSLVAQRAQAPSSAPVEGPGLLFLILLVGVALTSAGGAFLWHRHRRAGLVAPTAVAASEPPLSPALAAEYYVGLAEQAIQLGDHAKALHWISLAREASPTSADLASTMAFVLGELGQFEEALAAYEAASRLDPLDGEADLNAARLAARAGRPIDEVEALVLRALDRSPEFVVDVEDDVEFRPLAIRASFREGVALAWERWGSADSGVAP